MSTERADHVTMAWRTNGCRGILFAEIFELNWYQLFLIQVLANTGSHLGHFSQVSWSFLTTALNKKKGNFKIYYRRVFCSQRSRTSGICQFSTLRPQRLLVGNFLSLWIEQGNETLAVELLLDLQKVSLFHLTLLLVFLPQEVVWSVFEDFYKVTEKDISRFAVR